MDNATISQSSHKNPFCTDHEDNLATSKLVIYNNLAFGIFNTCLTIATIFLNSITIAAYVKSPLLKGKLAYFLVMLLSVNDLMVGLTSNVLFAATLLKEYNSKMIECILHDVQIFLLLFLSGCSFKSLVVMSWERYAAICHPLFHRTKVTRKRLLKCMFFLWFLALLGTVLSWYFEGFFAYVIIPELLAFNVFLVYIYVRIYLANSKSLKNLRNIEGDQNAERNEQRRQNMVNVKLAKSCFLAVITFVVCYLPSSIITNGAFEYERGLKICILVWAETLILANSTLNSIVFFWRNKFLRQEACAVVNSLLCATKTANIKSSTTTSLETL